MFYAWDVEVPADTKADVPVEKILGLSPGVIVDAGVKFPSGCHGLVKVRLFQGEFQLYPLSRGEWVTGDDEEVPLERYYRMPEEPAELKLRAVSPGTTYVHTVTLRLIIVPERVASMGPLLELLTRVMQRIGLVK